MLRWLLGRFRFRGSAPESDAANATVVPSNENDPLAGDALPEVVDESSAEAWARWHEALEASRNWDSKTQPLELRPDDPQE